MVTPHPKLFEGTAPEDFLLTWRGNAIRSWLSRGIPEGQPKWRATLQLADAADAALMTVGDAGEIRLTGRTVHYGDRPFLWADAIVRSNTRGRDSWVVVLDTVDGSGFLDTCPPWAEVPAPSLMPTPPPPSSAEEAPPGP